MKLSKKTDNAYSHIRTIMLLALSFICFMSSATHAQPSYRSGNIFGESWTSDFSPYIITDTLRVVDSLHIGPGVEVIFQGHFGLEILEGALFKAEGGIGEEMIVFSSASSIWAGIKLIDSADSSTITNCKLLNASTAINCIRSNPFISGNIIDARSIGISCIDASPIIVENDTIRVVGEGGSYFRAISVRGEGSSPQIIRNNWIECRVDRWDRAAGIQITRSSPFISENWIEVTSREEAIGIDAEYTNGVGIVSNIIRVVSAPTTIGLRFQNCSRDSVYRNDIIIFGSPHAASIGIEIIGDSIIRLLNNILVGNTRGVALSAFRFQLEEDFRGYNAYYQWEIIYTGLFPELDGDIVANPIFVRNAFDPFEADYRLQWVYYPEEGDSTSPCIDAGFPDSSWNDTDDLTRSDIGRYHFFQYPLVSVDNQNELTPSQFEIISVYPNPFNMMNRIAFSLPALQKTQVTLHDISGRQIDILWSGVLSAGRHEVNWSGNTLSAGSYLIRLQTGDEIRTNRVVYLP